MIEYRLRSELSNLFVCLYNPYEQEDRFTVESLINYINDCKWQLERGERVKRFPFHVTNIQPETVRAIEEMKRTLQAIRKENNRKAQQEQKEPENTGFSWGYSGGYYKDVQRK